MNANGDNVVESLGFERTLSELRLAYESSHPASRTAMQKAETSMPGGNTRSVLHADPFPLVITAGEGAHVVDLDGHRYLDCVGEFSAGLYGHRNPVIRQAIVDALATGLTLGGVGLREGDFAQLVCSRFASVDKVRFCNSGTEANLLALLTARAVTGRNRFVVFDGAYHGGVLNFPSGKDNPLNAPFSWQVLPFNDTAAITKYMQENGDDVAAVIVEPILGAGGNIPGTHDFLRTLRATATSAGALLIFDEVKTSRCGPGGVQQLVDVMPDLTTLGKYLGGGLTLGAFGGREEIMQRFNPAKAGSFSHAGTFNNNVLSMAAGYAGLSEVYTVDRARQFHERTEAFRKQLQERLRAADFDVWVTGHGSMFSLHVGQVAPSCAADVADSSVRLRRLMQLHCLESGVRVTTRGDIYLSLAMEDSDLEMLMDVLFNAVDRAIPLVR